MLKVLNDINSILFPPVCFGCEKRLSLGEVILCTYCRHDLPLTYYTFNEENAIDRLFYGRVSIEKAISFLEFSDTGMVKNLLHYLKYKNQESVASFIGDWFGQEIIKNGTPEIDFVIPVPLHQKRLKKRGYNQVTLLAKKLTQHLNAHFRDDVLIKKKNTPTQTKKDRFARWINNQDLFAVQNYQDLNGKNILLVDDVITTGATIEACAHAILKATNAKIYVATMATVLLNRN